MSPASEACSAFDRHPDVDSSAVEAALVAAFGRRPQRIERTVSGVSTAVYRVVVDDRTYYARLAEDADDDLTVDARVLTELVTAGVSAPEVVHLDPFDPPLRRSLLITTEIPGTPIGPLVTADAEPIVREAGRDLALIHQLPVRGFGFVRRNRPTWPPVGEFASYEASLTPHSQVHGPGASARSSHRGHSPTFSTSSRESDVAHSPAPPSRTATST